MKATERYRRLQWWQALPAVPIAAFYLVSVAGWFLAMSLAFSGTLGAQAREWSQGLNAFDHLVRVAQVVAAAIASFMLLFLTQQAEVLFKYLALCSAMTTVLLATGIRPQWCVSFIGGYGSLPVIAIVYAYVRWLTARVNTRAPNQAL